MSADELQMLQSAREKAGTLLNELLRRQADLGKNPPDLAPDDLERGRMAMQKAIEAARRMVQNLEDALRQTSVSTDN